MRGKAKYALPAIHVTLAVLLVRCGDSWQRRMEALIHGSVGTSPQFRIVAALNAPVSIVRAFTFFYLPGHWDYVVSALAIALFWYWFAINVAAWQASRSVVGFRWLPLRIASDLALIACGLLMA